MKKYKLKINYSNDILPIVSGKVFHVTPTSNMPSIKETGALVPNSHLLHHSEFGNTANGFFRLKGCVSFFDYRCINTPHWEQHAYKCFPTQILNHNDSISILFLNENEYDKLIPWTMWKKEKAWSERVVPWVETGYKGNVPLINITQEIIVEYNT